MIKKYFTITVIIIILSFILQPSYAFASRSVEMTLTTDDLVVAEGETVTLNVKFTNNTGSSVGIQSYSVNGGTPVSVTTDNICNSPGSYYIMIDYTVNFGPNTQSEVYVDVTYSGTGIMTDRTASSNTLVFEKAESVNTALEFTVIPNTTTVETGGEVEYTITIRNNGSVGYDNFDITLNGSVIKTYSILPIGSERTFKSTQGYYSNRTEKFGYKYDYTYRGVSGQIEDTNAQQYTVTVTGPSLTASTTGTQSATTDSVTATTTAPADNSLSSKGSEEQFISSDINSTIELIISRPKYDVQVGDNIDLVIVVKNTGNGLLKDVLLSDRGTDELKKWDRILPNAQKKYVDTITVQLDSVHIYRVIANDVDGKQIEIVSEPIFFNIISDHVNESGSDNLIVEGLKSEYRYLIAIIIILISVMISIILIYPKKKKSMNQVDS